MSNVNLNAPPAVTCIDVGPRFAVRDNAVYLGA